jgi:hypothetical protein
MITTIGKATEKRCLIPGLTETGNCIGPDCMGWKFWVPPPGGELNMQKPSHGIKDSDKKGYCGLTGKY